jgi:hypothetical protein
MRPRKTAKNYTELEVGLLSLTRRQKTSTCSRQVLDSAVDRTRERDLLPDPIAVAQSNTVEFLVSFSYTSE